MPDLALFDFDGTITTCETMPAFMYRAVPARRQVWGRVLLAPWVAGYRCGLVSAVAVRSAVVRVGFSGVPVEAVRARGVAFAVDTLPTLLRPEVMVRIRQHQQQGDTVAVVSGGLDVYLAPWCREHGLALVCSALEDREGRLTGRYLGAQCVGEEKARRVRAGFDLAGFRRIHAYGDTHEDRALLELAHHRVYRGREKPIAGR